MGLLGKPTILGNNPLGGSKNRGIPKWMVKIMEHPKMDDLGGKPHHLGNIHIQYSNQGQLLTALHWPLVFFFRVSPPLDS